MNKQLKDKQRRALRAQLLQTYKLMMETPNVYKQADYRLKSLRLQLLDLPFGSSSK